jgi:hypothetical protein
VNKIAQKDITFDACGQRKAASRAADAFLTY